MYFSTLVKGSPMNKPDFSHARFGNNVTTLMDIHNITVEDLADQLGVTPQAIYNLRNHGVKALTPQRAAQLASILKVDYYKIFPLIVNGDD